MRALLGLTLFAILATAVGLFFYSDRGEIREITTTTSTSDCISDPKTPACAVETLLACTTRLDGALCSTALHGSDATRCKEDPLSPGCDDLSDEVYDEMGSDARYRIGAIR